MNKPAHPLSCVDNRQSPYGGDAYGWAMAQARFLREQQLDAIDCENLTGIRAEAFRQAWAEAVAQTGFGLDSFPLEPPGWNVIDNSPVSKDDIPVR